MSKSCVCGDESNASNTRVCIKCSHRGPYCENCPSCTKCKNEYPGSWGCGGDDSDHNLVPGKFMAVCVDCDEFLLCEECVTPCECGHDPVHFICFKASHECFHCSTPVCRKYGTMPIGKTERFCAKHYPERYDRFCAKVKKIVRRDKRLREELHGEL